MVLFIGGASVAEAWGDAKLTLTAQDGSRGGARAGVAPIAPIHQDGWAHFTSSATDVEREFAEAGLSDRLRPVSPGQRIELA